MKNIENLVGRMHQKSEDSLLNREGWNVCRYHNYFNNKLLVYGNIFITIIKLIKINISYYNYNRFSSTSILPYFLDSNPRVIC